MNDPTPPTPRLIRLFSDHAGTVLWLGDPVDYDESGLGTELIAALRSWEESGAFHRGAATLAERVAVEVGERYEVGYAGFRDGIPAERMHYPGRATNPDAEAAFDLLFDAERRGFQGSTAGAGDTYDDTAGHGRWYAYAPLTGSSLDPGSHRPGR